MKKIISILIGLLFVAAVGYSVMWYVAANNTKKQIVDAVEDFNKEFGDATKISYEEMKVSGFPTKHDVTLKNFKLSFGNEDRGMATMLFDTISILEVKKMQNYMISLGNESITEMIPGKNVEGAKPFKLLHKAEVPSTIEIAFKEPIDFAQQNKFDIEVLKKISKFSMTNDAIEVTNAEDNQKVMSALPGFLTIAIMDQDKNRIANLDYSLEYKYEPAAAELFKAKEQMADMKANPFHGFDPSLLGELSSKASITVTYAIENEEGKMPIFDLQIKNFDIVNKLMNLNIAGSVVTKEALFMPMADIKLHLKDYKSLFDSLVNDSKTMTQKEADVANKILNKLGGGDENNPGFDVTIPFTSNGMGEFKIGQMSFQDVTAYVDEENKKLKADAGNEPVPVVPTPGEAKPEEKPTTPTFPETPKPTEPIAPSTTTPISPATPTPTIPKAPSNDTKAPIMVPTPAAPPANGNTTPAPAPSTPTAPTAPVLPTPPSQPAAK